MRPYEVMIILDSSVEDATVETAVGRVRDTVTAAAGTVVQVEKWGRRRFAYEMKHRNEGYYTLVQFSSEPSDIAALDRVLTLADEVLRHKIVRLPESVVGNKPSSNNDAESSASPPGAEKA